MKIPATGRTDSQAPPNHPLRRSSCHACQNRRWRHIFRPRTIMGWRCSFNRRKQAAAFAGPSMMVNHSSRRQTSTLGRSQTPAKTNIPAATKDGDCVYMRHAPNQILNTCFPSVCGVELIACSHNIRDRSVPETIPAGLQSPIGAGAIAIYRHRGPAMPAARLMTPSRPYARLVSVRVDNRRYASRRLLLCKRIEVSARTSAAVSSIPSGQPPKTAQALEASPVNHRDRMTKPMKFVTAASNELGRILIFNSESAEQIAPPAKRHNELSFLLTRPNNFAAFSTSCRQSCLCPEAVEGPTDRMLFPGQNCPRPLACSASHHPRGSRGALCVSLLHRR